LPDLAANQQTIQLQNPVSDHFEAFIVGNSYYDYPVLQQDAYRGQHVVICGAGPSLADHAAEWTKKGDQVWGCNSALMYLRDNGHKVTHGFTVDQTAHMVSEWWDAPDVEYFISTTSHPHLTDWLKSKNRSISFFHNFVGISKPPVVVCRECHEPKDMDAVCCGSARNYFMNYEDWLYQRLYQTTVRAGSGLNTVSRAIDVASFLGFDRISVLGADCALRIKCLPPDAPVGSAAHTAWLTNDVVMHADGGHALKSEATPVTMGGTICPKCECAKKKVCKHCQDCDCEERRHWETKPDMMITAVWLTKMQQKYGRRLKLVGDTLPNALKAKNDKFLKRLPSMTDSEGNALIPD
jgi:hypothetical protein